MARWETDSSSTIPEWFFTAVETEYQTVSVEVDDCDVVYQRWGQLTSRAPCWSDKHANSATGRGGHRRDARGW